MVGQTRPQGDDRSRRAEARNSSPVAAVVVVVELQIKLILTTLNKPKLVGQSGSFRPVLFGTAKSPLIT